MWYLHSMKTSLTAQLIQAAFGAVLMVAGTIMLPISAPAFLLSEKLHMRRLAKFWLTLYIVPGAGFGMMVLSVWEFKANRV